jgi:homocysteine S-methyltransferase
VVSVFAAGEAVLVADGGLATELEARGNDLSDALWSARLLADAPEEILGAHLAFFRAGAQIATSASYQASFEGFARRGLGRRQAAGLMRRSVDLARTARDQVAWHRSRLDVLAEAGPDVLALETVPDTDEAEALMAAIAGLGVPAWLSYTIAAGRTRAGQPLAGAFAVAAGVPQVVAVGVNCCAPADVPAAIAVAREVTGKPVIVYPNSGEEWDARRRAWTGRSRYCSAQPRQWIAAGADIVGGCCRVRPADIAEIAQALHSVPPGHP